MTIAATNLTGVVRGKTIELEQESGLPDGQRVTVTVQPTVTAGERLRKAFGAWSDDPEGLDKFIEQTYRDRESDSRPEASA